MVMLYAYALYLLIASSLQWWYRSWWIGLTKLLINQWVMLKIGTKIVYTDSPFGTEGKKALARK